MTFRPVAVNGMYSDSCVRIDQAAVSIIYTFASIQSLGIRAAVRVKVCEE